MSQYPADPNRYDGRMPYRKCGRWGLKLPLISVGCWHNFGGDSPTEAQRTMLYEAFDLGVTHFDLANNYGPPYGSAEVNVGKIIKDLPRDELVISTKAGYDMWPGPYGEWGSRKYLLASLDQSLKRMDLEYVDIFYSHRFDPDTPLDETLGALETAVKQGKALYTGISSYNTENTKKAAEIISQNQWTPLLIHQPNYSMLNRWVESSLLQTCDQLGAGVIAFCPLYQGLLTDRYLKGVPEGSRASLENSPLRQEEVSPEVIQHIHALNQIAAQREQSLSQMALSWILKDPRVTSVVAGASRVEQLRQNCQAATKLEFSADHLQQIDSILGQIQLPQNLWET